MRHSMTIIALARKIATMIWNLITNDKMYEDETYIKREKFKRRRS
jgi:transposase